MRGVHLWRGNKGHQASSMGLALLNPGAWKADRTQTMSHTAWTKASSQRSYGVNRGTHHSSGLTSDPLIPRGGSSRRVKGHDQPRLPSQPKKSRDVQKLENLIEAVDSASYLPKYPKEGCFCRGKCLFDLGLPLINLH